MATGRRGDGTPGGAPAAPPAPVDLPYRRGRRKGQDGFGGGLVALRGALTELARAPVGVLTGISVSLDLSGGAGQTGMLLDLCRELGERYGLEVLPRLHGSKFDVRFRRRAAGRAGRPHPAPGRRGRATTADGPVPGGAHAAFAVGA
jgi:hypothetical protein